MVYRSRTLDEYQTGRNYAAKDASSHSQYACAYDGQSYCLRFMTSAGRVVGGVLGRRRVAVRVASLYPGRNNLDRRLRFAVFGT